MLPGVVSEEAPIRVLIVDDSAVARRIVATALEREGGFVVAGMAETGRVALDFLSRSSVDAVVLDLEMPELDGCGTLRELRKTNTALPVLVFSSLTERGAKATISALFAGADDYLCKPEGLGGLAGSLAAVRAELVPKLRALVQARRKVAHLAAARAREQRPAQLHAGPALIAIGSSAGGPQALSQLIGALPAELPVPVVVVQHMPAGFTKSLADRLNAMARVRVVEAVHQQRLLSGVVHIAPGDQHLQVDRQGEDCAIVLDRGPLEHGCRPSVDRLFASASRVYGRSLLSVVLTGMGKDGLAGAAQVRAAGGSIWVQDEQSSAVWGMAGAVVGAGLADRIWSLGEIGPALASLFGFGLVRNATVSAGQP